MSQFDDEPYQRTLPETIEEIFSDAKDICSLFILCKLCNEPMSDEGIFCIEQCAHIGCKNCLLQSVQNRQQCPICMVPVQFENEVTQLFPLRTLGKLSSQIIALCDELDEKRMSGGFWQAGEALHEINPNIAADRSRAKPFYKTMPQGKMDIDLFHDSLPNKSQPWSSRNVSTSAIQYVVKRQGSAEQKQNDIQVEKPVPTKASQFIAGTNKTANFGNMLSKASMESKPNRPIRDADLPKSPPARDKSSPPSMSKEHFHSRASPKRKNPSPSIILETSCLPTSKTENAKTWCNELGGACADEFNAQRIQDQFTHLVVQIDRDNIVSKRTFKYLTAKVSGKHILNYKWIVDSHERGRFLPEGPYLVRGDQVNRGNDIASPNKSKRRSSNLQNIDSQQESLGWLHASAPSDTESQTPLFQDVFFILKGRFEPPVPCLSDLTTLILAGGGTKIRESELGMLTPSLPTRESPSRRKYAKAVMLIVESSDERTEFLNKIRFIYPNIAPIIHAISVTSLFDCISFMQCPLGDNILLETCN